MERKEQIDNKPELNSKQGVLSVLGPKKSFILGIITVILVGSTIGFFVLLFSDAGSTVANSKNVAGTSAAVTTNTNSTPSAGTTAPPSQQISIKPITSEDHVRGDLNTAEVVVVEFSDLECPFCKRFHPTMQQIVEEYDGQIAWVYRHFPLDSLHPKARKEAEATECANELGGNDGFWAYLDRLFEITPSNNGLEASQLPQIAEDVGLKRAEFESCLESGKYAQVVADDLTDAQTAGGSGTPYSVAITKDGQKIPISGAVPLAQVKSIIDPLL